MSASPRSSGLRLLPLRMLPDDRLAELAAAGDRHAFGAIYDRYHQALFRYCRSILRSDEDARDALQNVMTSALRALDGERRQVALKPWLYRIAHNESVSVLRRRRDDVGLDEVDELPGRSGADHATRERLRELVGDLRELPDQQRGALVMRELSGLDYREIGAIFGITPAAATQAVYDARRGLQELAEGRAMECEAIRRLISANDRRSLRARKVRGHLRTCGGCRDFEAALAQRPKDLAALAPVLPAPAAVALFHAVAGSGAGTSGGGGLAALTGGAGKAASVSAIVKGVAAVAVVATIGTGAVEVGRHIVGSGSPESGSKPAAGSGSAAGHAGQTAVPGRMPLRPATRHRTAADGHHERSGGHHARTGDGGRGDQPAPGGSGRSRPTVPSRGVHPSPGSGRGNAPARQQHGAPSTSVPSHPSQPSHPQAPPTSGAPAGPGAGSPRTPPTSPEESAPSAGADLPNPGR
jgi:RNA polymerase sigma factor (sigma-70 family)